MEFNNSLYEKLKGMFATLRDDDPQTAYQIAKESVSAKAYYEEKLAEAIKEASELDYEADRIAADISNTQSPDNVSKGQRIADASTEVLEARKLHARMKWVVGQLQARVNFLESIHFTAKMVYENMTKNYRRGA